MTTSKNPPRDDGAPAPAPSAPPLLLVAAWLVPGLGHWILGKRKRALIFASVVMAAFVTGVLCRGELGIPRAGNPFSWLASVASCGVGLPYFLRLVWVNGLGGVFSSGGLAGLVGGGDPVAAGFAYGNTFLYTAGLMNLLMVLDVSDLFRGLKD